MWGLEGAPLVPAGGWQAAERERGGGERGGGGEIASSP